MNETLQQLEDELQLLGRLVEGILIEAADILRDSDLDAMERLRGEVWQVHRKRLAIEMGCLSLIASHHPLDVGLQPLVATMEIAAEMERLADHCHRVARANYLSSDLQLRQPLAGLHHLASEVRSLLDGALAAFAERDAGAARTVSAGIQEVESPYQQMRDELLIVAKSQPSIANQAIYLSRAAYNLRRAAERAASICGWVVFAVEGSFDAGEPTRVVPAHQTRKTSAAI
jgi:phosphate transport system protein